MILFLLCTLECYRIRYDISMFYDSKDFVVLRTEKKDAEGNIMVLSRSVVHQSAEPRYCISCALIYLQEEFQKRRNRHGWMVHSAPDGEQLSSDVFVSRENGLRTSKVPRSQDHSKTFHREARIAKFVKKELKSSNPPIWKQLESMGSMSNLRSSINT